MKSVLRAVSVTLVVCMTALLSVAQTPQEDAWATLNNGLTNKSWEKRVRTVALLGELTGDKKAEAEAITALKDDKEEVRGAAAQALGEMGAKSAIPQLMGMISDQEPAVTSKNPTHSLAPVKPPRIGKVQTY
jgi:HEAT repeat protein